MYRRLQLQGSLLNKVSIGLVTGYLSVKENNASGSAQRELFYLVLHSYEK